MILKIAFYSLAYLLSTIVVAFLLKRWNKRADDDSTHFVLACLFYPIYFPIEISVICYVYCMTELVPNLSNKLDVYLTARKRRLIAKAELKELTGRKIM